MYIIYYKYYGKSQFESANRVTKLLLNKIIIRSEMLLLKMMYKLGQYGPAWDFVRRLRVPPRFCSCQWYPSGHHSGINLHTDAHTVTYGFVVTSFTVDDPSIKASLALSTGLNADRLDDYQVNLGRGEAVAVPYNIYHLVGTVVRPGDRFVVICGW
jgi:hypothetical protein